MSILPSVFHIPNEMLFDGQCKWSIKKQHSNQYEVNWCFKKLNFSWNMCCGIAVQFMCVHRMIQFSSHWIHAPSQVFEVYLMNRKFQHFEHSRTICLTCYQSVATRRKPTMYKWELYNVQGRFLSIHHISLIKAVMELCANNLPHNCILLHKRYISILVIIIVVIAPTHMA